MPFSLFVADYKEGQTEAGISTKLVDTGELHLLQLMFSLESQGEEKKDV